MFRAAVMTLALATAAAAEAAPAVRAHLTGENNGKVDTEITVSEVEQTIFHHHADFDGGGIWCNATIVLRDDVVVIHEANNVSSPFRGGDQIATTAHTWRLPVARITSEPIELSLGNRVVLRLVAAADVPAATPSAVPGP